MEWRRAARGPGRKGRARERERKEKRRERRRRQRKRQTRNIGSRVDPAYGQHRSARAPCQGTADES